jgi:hypothetical protein
MKFVSFLFFASWVLPAVQSHEDGRNLRASKDQMQEGLQPLLDQSLSNLNEEFEDDRELLFISAGAICRRINRALNGNVDCVCGWGIFPFLFEFTCPSTDSVNLAGLRGVPVYSGKIDFQVLKLGIKVAANVCLTTTTFGDQNFQDLCVGGGLCAGVSGFDSCGCEASYGGSKCACAPCNGGVQFDCKILDMDLPALCIPLPFVRSLRPKANSVDLLQDVEEEVVEEDEEEVVEEDEEEVVEEDEEVEEVVEETKSAGEDEKKNKGGNNKKEKGNKKGMN